MTRVIITTLLLGQYVSQYTDVLPYPFKQKSTVELLLTVTEIRGWGILRRKAVLIPTPQSWYFLEASH